MIAFFQKKRGQGPASNLVQGVEVELAAAHVAVVGGQALRGAGEGVGVFLGRRKQAGKHNSRADVSMRDTSVAAARSLLRSHTCEN